MRYPAERKEAILKKMAPPMSMTIPELAEQEGITATTLYNWRKQARARGQVLPSRSTPVSYTHLTLPTNREV